jgi:4-amino-4-deoxy-L-arabinose transferase-like glycosyltransferase
MVSLVFFQLNTFSLGHFWDEAWVYAPAIRTMATTIPSILPDAISTDLSRGHPLLLQFFGGMWMKIFGMSNTSAHVFAMCITLSTMIIVYRLLKKSFGGNAALLGVALVSLQGLFIAQSLMLYPEMLMSLGLVLALKGLIEKKTATFIVGLSISIYSKESAVVFLLAFICYDLLRLYLNEISLRDFRKYLIPFLVLLSHPILQFIYHGWFLYPNHTDLVNADMKDVKYQARHIFRFLFERQNRGWMFYPIIGLSVLALRLKNIAFSVLLIGIGFAAYKVFVWKWVVDPWLYNLIIVVSILSPLFVWRFARSTKPKLSELNHLVGVTYILLLGFLLFSAMNFYTPRYLLVCVILLCIAVSAIVWRNRWLPRWAKLVVSICLVSTSLYTTATERTVGELNLGLYDELRVNHAMTNWMENNVPRDAVFCTNFVNTYYIRDQNSGYVSLETFFYGSHENICEGCDLSEYVLITAIVKCPYDVDLESDYESVFEIRQGKSFAFIYKRKTTP